MKDECVVTLFIYAQPGARVSGIQGEFDGALKIKISSPPVEGAANEAIGVFLAEKLGIKRRDVSLIHGHSSRKKTFEIVGVKASDVMSKLLL